MGSPASVDGTELVLLFLFGACQLGIGFILFTTGARLIPAGEAILLSLLETMLARSGCGSGPACTSIRATTP